MAEQRHGSSAKKMADTESLLICSKNGRNRVKALLLKIGRNRVVLLKKWQTHIQTERFDRYILVR